MADIDVLEELDVKLIVEDVIEKILGGENSMKADKMKEWSDSIAAETVAELAKLKKNFKYIVTVMINELCGAGLNTHSSCWFNNETDVLTTVQWEIDALFCVVSIYSLAIN